ncbi:hypothetical protein H0H87_008519 [Tephrocybe sp. NHM501043]|nr:hypothetical protein H0H87_008519 [Tephrocybe sp. NHM501043]
MDQNNTSFTVSERDTSPDPGLYVQAYEADIFRGPDATMAAASLEAPMGNALIKWGGQSRLAFPQDGDNLSTQTNDEVGVIWVDRYDVRLLLDTLPPLHPSETIQAAPDSPGGWSDLPSDSEDVFFLSPEEVEDYRRDKKRRHIEHVREERLKARRAEDGELSAEEEDVWGGSDEEPDDAQRDLMQRTATHLMSSPNSTQLEARILANHGSDARFAFLRGRWSNTWKLAKGKAKMAKAKEEQEKQSASGLGVLAGYGDSDADSEEDADARDKTEIESQPAISSTEPNSAPRTMDAEALKEARRARAKEWAEKRRNMLEKT